MSTDKIRKLEGRIEELENALGRRAQREAVDLSADELKAYIKVRDVIAADYGEFCGINDCFRCYVCNVCVTCRICRFCDVECICGPCNIRGGAMGGLSDFRQFGG